VKKLRGIQRSVDRHWVGDGFPVRTLFAYPNEGELLSPFLLLDYAGPTEFSPTTERRGVGAHPHRGFETVTIVYAGEVEHRDSSGGGGRIGEGDVQWMTAASGIVHEEFHGREYAKRGGPFEMVQLWVNLPRKDKTAPPGYQAIVDGQIPSVALAGGLGTPRVDGNRRISLRKWRAWKMLACLNGNSESQLEVPFEPRSHDQSFESRGAEPADTRWGRLGYVGSGKTSSGRRDLVAGTDLWNRRRHGRERPATTAANASVRRG